MSRRIHRLLVALASVASFASAQWCPPLGPVFPTPTKLAEHPLMRAVLANLTAQLGAFTSGRSGDVINGVPFAPNITYSSIGLRSIHDDDLLFEHHHMPAGSRNVTGGAVTTLNRDSVYRIASISKVFTVLLVLQQHGAVSLDDAVTKYVPELAAAAANESVSTVDWSRVTVGGLASHLAGVGRTYTLGDAAFLQADEALRALGLPLPALSLPSLNDSEVPRCGNVLSGPPCSRQEFLSGYIRRHPVVPSFASPIYSNAAFALLGFVIEAVTKKDFNSVLVDGVLKPLGMNRTSLVLPAEKEGNQVIAEPGVWRWDLGVENPTGGMYSSLNDLLTFGRAVLRSDLLPPALTRRWLKPWTHAPALHESVGAPWEIFRLPSLAGDGRVIDVYSKAGGLPAYSSFLVLLPDYGLVAAVLVTAPIAAPGSVALRQLWLHVLRQVVPAADAVAREQAAAAYAGVYVARATDGSSNSSSSSSGNASATSVLRISVDDPNGGRAAGPGLKVDEFRVRGNDVARILTSVGAANARSPGNASLRLYPTGLESSSSNASTATDVSFRAQVGSPPPRRVSNGHGSCTNGSSGAGGGAPATSEDDGTNDCIYQWVSWDTYAWANNALDDFVFTLGADGRATKVEARAWRLVLERNDAAT